MSATERFVLAADASSITDTETGKSWSTAEVARMLFPTLSDTGQEDPSAPGLAHDGALDDSDCDALNAAWRAGCGFGFDAGVASAQAHLLDNSTGGKEQLMPISNRMTPSGARGDQMPRGGHGRNFDQDPNDPDNGMNNQENGTRLDARACLFLVQKCVSGLDADEKGKFIESLSNMITEDNFEQAGIGGRSNVPATRNGNNNTDPITGMPRPDRTAGDRGIRSGMRGATDRRRPGMDAALSSEVRALQQKSFSRRFPFLNVRLDPMGR